MFRKVRLGRASLSLVGHLSPAICACARAISCWSRQSPVPPVSLIRPVYTKQSDVSLRNMVLVSFPVTIFFN